MGSSNILTVRLPESELIRLNHLATLRNRTRSQIVQETVTTLISQSEELRSQELEHMRSRV